MIEQMNELASYRMIGTSADGKHRAIQLATARRVEIAILGSDETVAVLLASSTLDAMAHRGAPRIVDHGTLADGSTWVASEAPEGIALADIMLRRTLAVDEVAALLRDTSDVLMAAHRRGVVHCNLRPDGIYFGTGSRHAPIILTDWLGMRVPGAPAGDMALSAYAAPELFGAFDGRADLYSLGVIAYRAFTGRFPDADPLHVPGASPALERLLVRMLATSPDRRPGAAEVHLLAGVMLEPDRDVAPRARVRWTPAHGMSVLDMREARATILRAKS